jgi:ElaB/YqjD/DUF883 family membrane-anchored ribosome-binding protein
MTSVCFEVAAGLWRIPGPGRNLWHETCKKAHRALIARKERRMTTTDGINESKHSNGTTTERVAAKAHDTVDGLAQRAERVERDVRVAAARTAEHARELHERATTTAEQGARRVADYLESNPLTCVGIAFAAGVLFSTLLRR